jgi:hypothetical protein
MSKIKKQYIKLDTSADGVQASVIPANLTPSNYTPGSTDIKGQLQGIDSKFGLIVPIVFGTRASPLSITAAGGITSGAGQMSTTSMYQILFIAGNGGRIDITASPQIEGHTVVGALMTIIATSDTNSVQFDYGTGLDLNGTFMMGNSYILELMWDGTNWLEVARNR